MSTKPTPKGRFSAKKSIKSSALRKLLSSKKHTALIVIPTFAIIGALVYQLSFAGTKYTFFWDNAQVLHPAGGNQVHLGKKQVVWRTDPAGNPPKGNGIFWQTDAWVPIGAQICVKVKNIDAPAEGAVISGDARHVFRASGGIWKRFCVTATKNNSIQKLFIGYGSVFIDRMSITLP